MTETATESAGYLGSSSVGSYAALGSSLFGSLGTILDANNNTKRAWELSYNNTLEQETRRKQTQLQNNNNSQVAGFNLQQLAIQTAGIENQAGIDYKNKDAAWQNRGQEGSGGIISGTNNAGGTGNYLQTAMQLKQVESEKQQALMRLSQGYQLPTPVRPYKIYTPWDSILKPIASSFQGLNKAWEDRQITSDPHTVVSPSNTLDGNDWGTRHGEG